MLLVKTLARLVLLVGVSGVVPQPFAYADGSDAAGLRAIHPLVATELIQALRSAKGIVVARDVIRVDAGARARHVHASLPAASIGVSPSGLSAALIQRGAVSRRFDSRPSAPLRGPPATI